MLPRAFLLIVTVLLVGCVEVAVSIARLDCTAPALDLALAQTLPSDDQPPADALVYRIPTTGCADDALATRAHVQDYDEGRTWAWARTIAADGTPSAWSNARHAGISS